MDHLTCSVFSLFPHNFTMQTVLELTMDHVLNSLEKLFGANNSTRNGKKDSDNMQSTKRKAQNSTRTCRSSPTDLPNLSNGGE